MDFQKILQIKNYEKISFETFFIFWSSMDKMKVYNLKNVHR